jgi:hypothetical protein
LFLGPLVHLVFTFLVVMTAASALGVEPDLAVYTLAIFGGLFPDFDHEKYEFIMAAVLSFVCFLVFGFNTLESPLAAFILAALSVLVLVVVRKRTFTPSGYKTAPRAQFKKEWWAQAKTANGLVFAAAFTAAAFILSGRPEIAALAFLAYASHSILDWLTYGTDFGIRFLVAWSDV